LLNRLSATAIVDFALAHEKYENFIGTRLPPFVDTYVAYGWVPHLHVVKGQQLGAAFHCFFSSRYGSSNVNPLWAQTQPKIVADYRDTERTFADKASRLNPE
jgi:hypothetical protein